MCGMKGLLFGAAYYDEYMPCERLGRDIGMMKRARINTVRIAESTWSTCEPQEGVFDFSHVERVLDGMEKAGIGVIVGTPAYAVPAWMVKSYPEVLATTGKGRGIYGPRQIMDITHPAYLFYAERIIRRLMERVAGRSCVIGYQLDNETKHYGTAGKNVQERFVKYLREKFGGDLDALNAEFGLDYWSNRIDAWEDFPDVRGTVNGSLGAEFERFQRSLVTEFLSWQAGIVEEYRRPGQFITHNLDFEWRGYSFGVQPDVDHFQVSKCLTVAGADIYHPSQDNLTGAEIAFGGDLIRSLKRDNYLILETQAQGYPDWTPYPGQLLLQAYSHIASGANGVMYWHWHSIHNSYETYWKGILSHDLEENAPYREICQIGGEFEAIGARLVNLKKRNKVAILVSNESLTALKWFGIGATAAGPGDFGYNDVVRWVYDVLYRNNVECDFAWPETECLEEYGMIIVPALYAAPDGLLERLDRYVEAGGVLVATFKAAFANENVKVGHGRQPRILSRCLGVYYQQFTFPREVGLEGEVLQGVEDKEARTFMELLIPGGAKTLVSYSHPAWGAYGAVTRNAYGKGTAYYIGCGMGGEALGAILDMALGDAGVGRRETCRFPVIVRGGTNDAGNRVWFYLNYSGEAQAVAYGHGTGADVLSGEEIRCGESIGLEPWGVRVVEERGAAQCQARALKEAGCIRL